MSTLIDNLNLDDCNEEVIALNFLEKETLYEHILDLSLDQSIRLEAFEKYYEINEDNSIELQNRLSGMYQFSGSKIIQQFIYAICMEGNLSSFLKLEAAKSLLAFDEATEGSDSDDDEDLATIKKESDDKIIERNNIRKESAYIALNHVCSNLNDMSTPCRVEAICMLMENLKYQEEANEYFKSIIQDKKIDCDFRYKTILSLENKNIEAEYFLRSACITFLTDVENMTMYRILSAQYLLQKCTLSDSVTKMVEQTLLGFAQEQDLDYNLRADAADTLLSLACNEIKDKAREIIFTLGRVEGYVKTVFDNAQNVHTDTVEESVAEVLEFLSTLSILEINNIPIEFEFVSGKIEKILSDRDCKDCKNKKDDEDYCSEDCEIQFQKHKNIHIALNRICMDRILYSKFNNTLINILLKIWTFITDNEHEEEMIERLLEELNEMSGTCSSGFASRLVNVISGFGRFNIKISFEEQIVANFTGRLNARARKITDKDSPFFESKLNDVMKIWLNDNTEIRKSVMKLWTTDNISEIERGEYLEYRHKQIDNNILASYQPNMKEIIEKYLEEDRDEKIENCIGDFSMSVLNEMTLPPSEFRNRQSFLLFFGVNMLSIREEMYNEFQGLITDSDFDLYIRKAIMVYEGET